MKKLKDLPIQKRRIAIKQAISTIKNKLKKTEVGSSEYIYLQDLLNKYYNVARK